MSSTWLNSSSIYWSLWTKSGQKKNQQFPRIRGVDAPCSEWTTSVCKKQYAAFDSSARHCGLIRWSLNGWMTPTWPTRYLQPFCQNSYYCRPKTNVQTTLGFDVPNNHFFRFLWLHERLRFCQMRASLLSSNRHTTN